MKIIKTRKHSSRMRTDRTVTSDRVANKDEQRPSKHEADCGLECFLCLREAVIEFYSCMGHTF